MKVPVERYLMQVDDGIKYKGHIKIGERKLDYEIKFIIPIPQLENIEPTDDAKEIHRLFKLTLKKEDVDIELVDEEYKFFCQMIIPVAVKFYHDPQTRRDNEDSLSSVSRMRQGTHPLSAYGASASIGVIIQDYCDFPSEICKMLSEPKFGCALALAA